MTDQEYQRWLDHPTAVRDMLECAEDVANAHSSREAERAAMPIYEIWHDVMGTDD